MRLSGRRNDAKCEIRLTNRELAHFAAPLMGTRIRMSRTRVVFVLARGSRPAPVSGPVAPIESTRPAESSIRMLAACFDAARSLMIGWCAVAASQTQACAVLRHSGSVDNSRSPARGARPWCSGSTRIAACAVTAAFAGARCCGGKAGRDNCRGDCRLDPQDSLSRRHKCQGRNGSARLGQPKQPAAQSTG